VALDAVKRRERSSRWRKKNPDYNKRWQERNREQYNDVQSAYREGRKDKLREIKLDRGCDRCGYGDHPAALDFHHRDPAEKEFQIGGNQNLAWTRVLAEIAKCDVICANCHRIEHSK
jgi:hypothetical protein